jgi:dTMP kinase
VKKKGCYIVVEGLEGAGKSTVIQLIKNYLETKVPSVLTTREPGGTLVGEMVRRVMKDITSKEPLDHKSELLLLYAARVQLVEQIIKPALSEGTWVVSDRSELSSYAYQGGGRGIDKNVLDFLSQFCLGQFKPDLLFFLDIDPEQGLERTKIRGEADRMELESLDFFKKVHQAYHESIAGMSNVVKINSREALDTVQNNIIAQLEKAFFQACTLQPNQ